jgi:hypothetical protein
MRMRILLGSLLLVAGLALYVPMTILIAKICFGQSQVPELIFYAAAGVAWIWPAARLTGWMQRAAPHRPPLGVSS